jgi:hypothetical protein
MQQVAMPRNDARRRADQSMTVLLKTNLRVHMLASAGRRAQVASCEKSVRCDERRGAAHVGSIPITRSNRLAQEIS